MKGESAQCDGTEEKGEKGGKLTGEKKKREDARASLIKLPKVGEKGGKKRGGGTRGGEKRIKSHFNTFLREEGKGSGRGEGSRVFTTRYA